MHIRNTCLGFFLTISIAMPCVAAVRIVCTAALTDNHFEFRKNQYIESFGILKNLGHDIFYVIEAVKKQGPTFLEEHVQNICYAQCNNPRLKNHGINEVLTLLEGCAYFAFEPEDIVIKLTGRYYLMSDLLIKTVEDNPAIDAFVKVNENGDVFTLGFAMRYKYLKEMIETIDYAPLEQGMIPVEYRVGDYIKKKKKEGNFNVIYMEKLDVKADLYGSSTAPGISGIGYY